VIAVESTAVSFGVSLGRYEFEDNPGLEQALVRLN
jgi:hypothetical protein